LCFSKEQKVGQAKLALSSLKSCPPTDRKTDSQQTHSSFPGYVQQNDFSENLAVASKYSVTGNVRNRKVISGKRNIKKSWKRKCYLSYLMLNGIPKLTKWFAAAWRGVCQAATTNQFYRNWAALPVPQLKGENRIGPFSTSHSANSANLPGTDKQRIV